MANTPGIRPHKVRNRPTCVEGLGTEKYRSIGIREARAYVDHRDSGEPTLRNTAYWTRSNTKPISGSSL